MKFLLFTVCAFLGLFTKSLATDPYMIWVEFTDKDNSPFTLSRPHEFLSQRAIERRYRQNIPIDLYDLPVSSQYVNHILEDPELTLYYKSRWFNGAMFGTSDIASLQGILDKPFVRFTELAKSPLAKKDNEYNGTQISINQLTSKENRLTNFVHEAWFPYSVYAAQTIHSGYGTAENQINMVNGQALHDQGYWGNGKVIAVLDSGFRSVDTLQAFQELWNNSRILGYRDFSLNKKELFQGHAHGTVVLSVMGAYLPGNYSGAAPSASYWLLRTEDAATEFRVEEYNWLAGAEFADSAGVDIINSSLGYTRFDDPDQNYTFSDLNGSTTVVARAANMAFSRGILVVSSAGNYGAQSWRYVGSPADAHGALAVGATNANGERASFSSFGPTYDGRIKPQIMAQGQGTAVVNASGGLSNANGTSFSAPLIAGLAACLWEMAPEATNNQIKRAIIRSSNQYMNPDTLYGFGIPDFEYAASLLKKDIEDVRFLKLLNNPLIPQSSISFYAYKEEVIAIRVFNSSGHLVWERNNISVIPGFNKITPFTDIDRLNSGIYFIRVNFKNRTEVLKAVKL